MAEWAAANISSSSSESSDDDISLETDHHRIMKNKVKRRRLSETPEAAIARLTTAYNAAMAAVRALHKASNKIVKDRKKKAKTSSESRTNKDDVVMNNEEEINNVVESEKNASSVNIDSKESKVEESIRQGALAARNAFENALLSDPLIMTYAPSLTKMLQKINNESKMGQYSACISSDAHEIAVKQLAYLTLMNYADLILTCTTHNSNPKKDQNNQDILDKGVVRVLDVLVSTQNNEQYSFWSQDEDEEQSKRLALVSYCDAVDLDGSDPTSWMKLACCARSVGRAIQRRSIICESGDDDSYDMELIMNQRIDKLSYHRLERFALERGLTILSPGIPCNRLIARAYKQFEEKMFGDVKPYATLKKQDDGLPDECIIDLPRDNWSTLGQLLLKACKKDQTCILRLKISPMLTLNSRSLGLICEFLGLRDNEGNIDVSNDVKNLEATCRTLSKDILSARTTIEKDRNMSGKSRIGSETLESIQKEKKEERTNVDVSREVLNDILQDDEKNFRVKRTSTRVQSQLLSSGKQAERSAKRKSVDYCLTCAVIPCTTDHPAYAALVKEDFNWESLASFTPKTPIAQKLLNIEKSSLSVEDTDQTNATLSSSKAVVAKSSVNSFISRLNGLDAVSNAILHNFLSHVSCFIEDVYSDVCSDEEGMNLPSCVIECYDLLTSSSAGNSKNFMPCWLGELRFLPNENQNIIVAMETLAINLLYAELQMRAGELHDNEYCTTFSDNIDKVKRMIPHLLQYSSALGESSIPPKHSTVISNLQVRTYWLVSIFYVFWSKRSCKMTDEKEAERQALKYIDNAISALKQRRTIDNPTISTPQLLSPGRHGDIWKELSIHGLQQFQNEFEASTVLSRCRQKFFGLLAEWKKLGNTSTANLDMGQKQDLNSIGKDLLKRFNICIEGMDIGENTDDLIDNFIANNVGSLTSNHLENNEINYQQMWPDAWDSIVISDDPIVFEDLSNASYVTMMSMAILHDDESQPHLASFLGSLILATKKLHTALVVKAASTEVGDNFTETVNKIFVLTHLAHLFLTKLWKLIQSSEQKGCEKEVLASIDSTLISHFLIQLSAGHDSLQPMRTSTANKILTTIPADLNLLKSTLGFVAYVKTLTKSEDKRKELETSIFVELCKIFVNEKEVISTLSSKPDKNVTRFEYEKLVFRRSTYVSLIASELAGILLSNPNTYGETSITESFLIDGIIKKNYLETDQNTLTLCALLKVVRTLSWFWNMISTKKSKISDCLRIPIAAAMIAILGSSGHAHSTLILSAFSQVDVETVRVGGPSDYFDSDDSANGIVVNDGIEIGGVQTPFSRKTILYSLCRCVQCIGLVFCACEDSEISHPTIFHYSQSFKGNLLPLVVVRVLGGISDFVLNEFSDTKAKDSAWAEDYPFGFRGAGAQLDTLLYKAYRCLHGISLSAQNNHLISSRGYAVPSVTQTAGPISVNNNFVPPESIKASAQLYRCIMRAYAGGRRTIPQGALECVLSAIPCAKESRAFKAIKNFIFEVPTIELLDCGNDTANVHECQDINMDSISKKIPDCLKNMQDINFDLDVDDDALKVRRGICQYFSDGPMPSLGSSNISSKPEDSKTVKDRDMASDAEKAVYQKIMYIIESLQYEPEDASKWYRAGLCLELKINFIMDRLQQSRESYNANDFYLKKFRSIHHREMKFRTTNDTSLALNDLIEHQYDEYRKGFTVEERLFSDDMSLYLKHQWTNFSNLKEMSVAVGRRLRKEESSQDLSQWSSIQSKFAEGDFAAWQSLWGRKFLVALNSMREKCFHAAFYLSTKQDIAKKGNLHPEIAESLGTMYYSDISQGKMTPFEVRERAKLAQSFFERALSSITRSKDEDDLAEYELQFMIGKCQEKIAKTLQGEAFNCTNPRKYKIVMEKSLECYDKALEAAKVYEEENGALESLGGGSAHGMIELIYRLHASRLKVMLKAVRMSRADRNMAEIEALKLTETYWHEQSNDTNPERKVEDVRDRVWAVLSDIVECMVYCRKEQPFFHRSVYRHAQTLLWAPLFHDPNGSIKEGSNATVPIHKSYKLRGLSSVACAASAEAILNSMFDKKRPQLCAVWVTTPQSPSPFEYMNDSAKKFDRLRRKYIGAFVDCMRLCGRRSTLETFIKWCYNSSRDLPSFYIATAMQEGEAPEHSHEIENMLLNEGHGLTHFAMQYANGAIAHIIRRESLTLSREKPSAELEDKVQELLNDAYKCFLRLNCSIDDGIWKTRRAKQKLSNCQILEVEALCAAYMTMKKIDSTVFSSILKQSPWDHKFLLLRSAVKDCERRFPAAAIKASSQCQKRKRKQKDQIAKENAKKHKDDEAIAQRKMIVNVPKCVKEGEKFVVEVCCEYYVQRVQLVSSGSKRIVFHLDIPKNITSDVNIKFING